MKCDQCYAAMINGIYCHETGCPNSKKKYDPEREQWIEYVDCWECGFPVEVGMSCDCKEPVDIEE